MLIPSEIEQRILHAFISCISVQHIEFFYPPDRWQFSGLRLAK